MLCKNICKAGAIRIKGGNPDLIQAGEVGEVPERLAKTLIRQGYLAAADDKAKKGPIVDNKTPANPKS